MTVKIFHDIMRCYNITQGGMWKRIFFLIQSPGIHAMMVYRLGNWLLKRNILFRVILDPIYYILNGLMRILWGIDIPRQALIGPGFYIGHFGGITISKHAVIGYNCNISQNITIGVSGQGEKRGVPILGNDVYIAPGARLAGKIVIGNNVKIGANTVIYEDIPNNSIVVLKPGYTIISDKGNRTKI